MYVVKEKQRSQNINVTLNPKHMNTIGAIGMEMSGWVDGSYYETISQSSIICKSWGEEEMGFDQVYFDASYY